jgi:cellulose synthase/poly-beta-1,6-N-acetylglucosamine synthase-like glycosyltransferase
MLTAVLNAFFLFSVIVITAYLIRHYIFTVAVLKSATKSNLPMRPPSGYQPTVTVLIPAHNEEHVIGALLQKMTELNYPAGKLEIFAIDDASTDKTGAIADSYAKLHSQIKVLHRGRDIGGCGKPAALNQAIKQAAGEIIIVFDADYIPHPDVVSRLVDVFADPTVGAVQGRPVVLNEPENIVTRLNSLERIGGYKIDEQARDLLRLIPQFGGTVGGFRKKLIVELGGFDENMITEDTDLTFTIALAGYRIRYADDAECYEEAVASWSAYWRQRQRWAKGHMQVCLKYWHRVLRSKHLTFRQKVDGMLLLNVYFMPLLTLVSLAIGAYLIVTGSIISGALWMVAPTSVYSFVGNYAPFFEIGVGAYLDGRRQIQWLTPLLIFSFVLNTLICGKAFLSLIVDKALGRKSLWVKTEHLGTANTYIKNPTMQVPQ